MVSLKTTIRRQSARIRSLETFTRVWVELTTPTYMPYYDALWFWRE